VVSGQLLVEGRERAKPSTGPLTIAVAMGSVEGDHWVGGHLVEEVIESVDLRPVGVLGRWDRSCTAAMAAWSWYGLRTLKRLAPSK
jgi:hypothetical protein